MRVREGVKSAARNSLLRIWGSRKAGVDLWGAVDRRMWRCSPGGGRLRVKGSGLCVRTGPLLCPALVRFAGSCRHCYSLPPTGSAAIETAFLALHGASGYWQPYPAIQEKPCVRSAHWSWHAATRRNLRINCEVFAVASVQGSAWSGRRRQALRRQRPPLTGTQTAQGRGPSWLMVVPPVGCAPVV